MMTGKFKEAIQDAQRSTKIDPTFIKGHFREAKCHLNTGDVAAAKRSLDIVQSIDPSNKDLVRERLSVATLEKTLADVEKNVQKKDWLSVVFYATRALEQAVHSVKLKLLKSEALAYQKKYDEALTIATDIQRSDSFNADAYFVRGMILYYQDNIDPAFQHFQQALRLSPDHQKAKELYKKVKQIKNKKEQGNEAYKANRLEEAYGLYTETLQIDPLNTFTNAKLYFNRAVVSAKVGTFEFYCLFFSLACLFSFPQPFPILFLFFFYPSRTADALN